MSDRYAKYLQIRHAERPKPQEIKQEVEKEKKVSSTILQNSVASHQEILQWKKESSDPEKEFWSTK